MKKASRKDKRLKRHYRQRRFLSGTCEKPRLCVNRTLKHMYAQIINDETGVTLVSVSSLSKEIKNEIKNINIESAKKIGKFLAEKAKEKNIAEVVFDRGGLLYHGRIKSLADGAREGGLKF